MKRPSADGGRFVMSPDGRTVVVAERDDRGAIGHSDRAERRSLWQWSVGLWVVVAAILVVWWQIDAGACSARVEAACGSGPCGPDAGWGCGLGGAMLLMGWVGIFILGAVVAGVAYLVSVLRAGRSDPDGGT